MAKKENDQLAKKEAEKGRKNKDDKDGQDNVIPEEILEAIPEEDRGRVSSIIRQTMISGVMRGNNPIQWLTKLLLITYPI